MILEPLGRDSEHDILIVSVCELLFKAKKHAEAVLVALSLCSVVSLAVLVDKFAPRELAVYRGVAVIEMIGHYNAAVAHIHIKFYILLGLDYRAEA